MPGVVLYISARKSGAHQARFGFAFDLQPFGSANIPPRIVLAPGSTLFRAVEESLTSFPYSAGLGLATKYLKFSSFQICQVRIGRFGTSGFSAQKEPLGP